MVLSLSIFNSPARAEVIDPLNYETRDIYQTFDSEDEFNKGIPSSPMDLLHELRKIGSMDDATEPADAIDEALRFFDEQNHENVPLE